MRIMKTLGISALVLFFTLSGCSPKAMETFSAWEPEITLYAGDTWEGEIPGDGENAAYTISVNNVPGLQATLEGNTLRLAATQAGDGQLTLAATAKGYQDTNLTLPILVEPRALDLTWTVTPPEEPEEGEDPDAWEEAGTVALLMEKTALFSFREGEDLDALTDAGLTAELSPPELGTIELGDGVVYLTAGENYGKGTLTVTARKENYEDAALSIPIAVVRGRLPISVTSGGVGLEQIDLENGFSAAITIATGKGAEIEAKMEGDAATLTRNGASYVVASVKPGDATLTITASGEGWLDSALTLPVVITKTKATVTPSATELSVEPGSSGKITFTTKPQGAAVTATVSGSGFTADITGNTLTVTAAETAEGSAEITLTVTADDYAEGKTTVTAAAKLEPIAFSLSANGITMEKGQTKGLTYTLSPAGCALTATATDGIAAKCGDGTLTITAQKSGTVTVTASLSGRDPVTATVKVTATEPIELPDVDTTTYANDAAEIIRLTNEYRQANGLGKLTHVTIIDTPATLRAEEAAEHWAHTRPDGTNFNTVFAQCGLKYAAYGENLFAVNVRYDPEDVVQAWKDSPTHDENLLRKNFTGIGVGVAKVNGEYYYCQLFIQE